MSRQKKSQVGAGSPWFHGTMLAGAVLGLLIVIWLVAACAGTDVRPEPTPSQPAGALPETPTQPPAPTPTQSPVPPTPSQAPIQSPVPTLEASTPVTAELKARVMAGLPPTPTPDPSMGTGWGQVDVGVLPLDVGPVPGPLWAAYSQGIGFTDVLTPFVAIYTFEDGDWLELQRVVVTNCAQYIGPGALAQVQLEPEHVWLELQSGTGAHSGCYDLLSFDGQALVVQASNFSSSPGAGWLQDVDGDGIQDVVLDHTDYYVFCYACGVRMPSFEVRRWDGEQLAPVELSALPETAPTELKDRNDRAVELAQAGLWADALEAITQVRAQGTQEPDWAEIISWNDGLIRLQADALTDQLRDGQYPLLENIFYGDYAAAVDLMRPYSMDELWGPDTPLVKGTVAEGAEVTVSDWISRSANLALGVEPDLAPAIFLRGWGAHLRDPEDPQALADVQRAAGLAADDLLYAESVAHLQRQGTMLLGPPEKMPAFEPLPPESCYELGQALMHTLQVTVSLTVAPFQDYVQGASGTGCQATAQGTGTDFESYVSVADSLQSMMGERGWREDQAYAAGGPTGMATAFRKEAGLCLASAGWTPSSDANCPPDQPISACDLAPEQQLYTIQINCAQESPSSVQTVETPSAALPEATPSPTPLAAVPDDAAPGTGEERWEVRTLLAGPGQPGRLYALSVDQAQSAWPTSHARLMLSDDRGQTWTLFPGGLPAEGCVLNVNMDYGAPASADALFASTCQGLYRWMGSAWQLLSPQETGMVAVVYGEPQTMWATEAFGAGGGVLRSDDGGVSWQPAGSGLVSFNGVANLGIDPRDANTVYAIIWPKYAGSYLRRGTSGGQWQTMPTPQDNSVIDTGMTIDGATGHLYVIVTSPNNQLWRSANPDAPDLGAVDWELVHDFGRDVQVELLASSRGPEGLALYANMRPLTWQDAGYAEVGEPVLQHSPDGGQSWTPLPAP